jgi:GTP cyclohydrolase II
MTILLGNPVSMHTRHGEVFVRHIEDASNSDRPMLREGVVVSGTITPASPTLVRVQSSCVFGEALHSTECDCAPQLSMALERIVRENGLLVYTFEEGRGAGLKNKLSAMLIQKRDAVETDEAFHKLGLEADLRNYELASQAIIALLGSKPRVTLMTNNPDKVKKLREQGIEVVGVQSAVPPHIDREALDELITKRNKFGHMIPRALPNE